MKKKITLKLNEKDLSGQYPLLSIINSNHV